MIRVLCDGVEHSFRALPITIGRDADNDLPIEDGKLSRHHCRICRTPEGIAVEDLGSSNGTFVNGMPSKRRVLAAGDTILIGVTSLNVEWDPEAGPPPKPRRVDPEEVARLARENGRLRKLLALVKDVASEREEEGLLRLIVDNAIDLTGAERGFLFVMTTHGLDFRVARDAKGKDLERPHERISHNIARETIESGKPVMTEDASGDARFSGSRSIPYLSLRAVLCVPLKVPDGPVGALYLENSLEGHFQKVDIPFATAFGDFAALALATARHLAQLGSREEQLNQSRARIGRLNARLKGLLRNQSRELAGVRADLDMSRQELGLRYDYNAIIGESPAMRKVLALLDRIIESDLPVLVSGESGTGKELIARAIHYNGSRREKRFVTVNCAAIPPDLIEAELFGREAGAYTGADEAAPGLFEQADGGTLFLDEVGDMPIETQGKLLRVLENGEVRRVGGLDVRRVSVRTVAATNRPLVELVKSGQFREDLYYRLNGVACILPALRDRVEDIPALFDHFLDAGCAEEEIERPQVSPEVVDRLQAYPWPGNVRELRNEVQRLLALQRGAITPDLLSLPIFSGDPEAVPPVNLPDGGLKELVENLERRVLLDTMRRTDGNKTRAAALLHLSRLGLRKKLERYGLNDA
jgi:transcriptional regulator with GAF, ATPase, and Fis domain